MKLQKGYSLMELLITVAIVGMLVGVGIPAYTSHVQTGKISEATSTLSGKRVSMEQYYQDNRQYNAAATACTTGLVGRDFDFVCNVATPVTYTITATGKGNMAGFMYTINEGDVKTSNTPAWGNSLNCWITQSNGKC